MKALDDNARLMNGTLPADPFDDAVPFSSPSRNEGDGSGEDAANEKPKRSELVIRVVLGLAELFHDPKQVAYALVRNKDGRRATLRLRSKAFRSWVAWSAREQLGAAVGTSTIEEALVALEGMAVHDREEHPVAIRVASQDGAIWIDLGSDDGRVVHVTSNGWALTTTSAVRFYRPSAMTPMVVPEHGGSIDALRPFLNVAHEDGFVLAVAWLVTALRPGHPYPIAALQGEQGTGKSTASRVLRSLVDPCRAPIRSTPRTDEDLMIAAQNAHVVAYDNLSGVPDWLSDALCRLATGAGFSKRELYSDADETVLEAKRPIILNGIDALAERSDLADRALSIELRPISSSERRDEAAFWSDFDEAAPKILGALLDGVVAGLANVDRVELVGLPRMADFARWTTAAEAGFDWKPNTVMTAFERQHGRAVEVSLSASPVASAVLDLLNHRKSGGTWQGEPRQLLTELNDVVGDEKRAAGWPKQANQLSRLLNRAKTFLREVGVVVEQGHRGHKRWIHLSLRVPSVEASSASSASSSELQSAEEYPPTMSEEHRRHRRGHRQQVDAPTDDEACDDDAGDPIVGKENGANSNGYDDSTMPTMNRGPIPTHEWWRE